MQGHKGLLVELGVDEPRLAAAAAKARAT